MCQSLFLPEAQSCLLMCQGHFLNMSVSVRVPSVDSCVCSQNDAKEGKKSVIKNEKQR